MAGKETSVQSEYMFSRSFRDSARLHLQHWIWKERLGYLLHPSIPISASDWTVADIGTGNACWLLDLARQIPSSWALQGFDVSPSQFPASQYLPSNVCLGVLDAFDDLPQDMIAKFDVVHIRAFAAVVKGGNPGPLMRNLIKLLKPSGYLQWDEFDTTTFAAHTPASNVTKEGADELIRIWHKFAAKLDIQLGWMPELADSFQQHGLTLNDYSRLGPTDLIRKPATDNWMMALEEVGFIIIGRGGEVGAQIAPKEYSALVDRAAVETQNGVYIWIDMQVVVGRKRVVAE